MSRVVPAAVVLVVADDRALVLRRTPEERSFPHMWCLPGGRIEEGEDAGEAAARETQEETGLAVTLGEDLGLRRVGLATRDMVFEIHRFVARADRAPVTLSPEHVDHRWLTREEAGEADATLPSGLAGEVTGELLAAFSRGEL